MECLEKIWSTLGVGENGYLNKPELLRLCQHVGVHASEDDISELFDGLNVNEDGRVSFEELVQLFHASKLDIGDDVVDGDPMSPSPGNADASPSSAGVRRDRRLTEDSGFSFGGDGSPSSSISFRCLSTIFSELDPFSTGLVTWEALCRWWEDQGVEDSATVLKALGYNPPEPRNTSVTAHPHNGTVNGRTPHLKTLAALKGRSMSTGCQAEMISLSSVAQTLEEVLSNVVQCTSGKKTNPDHWTTVAALLAYKEYCRLLKSDVDAATRQIDKARQDLALANSRAAALAQEVDDQNARMEKSEREREEELEAQYGDKLRQLRKELEESRHQTAKETRIAEETAVRLEELESERLKTEEKLAAFKEEVATLKEARDELREGLETKTEETEQLVAQLRSYETACEEDRLRAMEDADAASRKLQELESLREEVVRLREENRRLVDENDVLVAARQHQQPPPRGQGAQQQQQWPDLMSGVGLDRGDGPPSASTSTSTGCSSPSDSASSPAVTPATTPSKKRVERAKSFGGSRSSRASIRRHRRKSLVTRVPSLSQELCLELCDATPTPPASEGEPENESETPDVERPSISVQVNGLDLSAVPADDGDHPTKIAGILSRLENVILELQSCSDGDAPSSPGNADEVRLLTDAVDKLRGAPPPPPPAAVVVIDVADVGCATDLTGAELEDRLRSERDASRLVAELEEAKLDLASKLDFLQTEYDDSEEYWQQKMEEERQYYEGHINSLSEKLNTLLSEFQTKLAEYEEAASSSSASSSSSVAASSSSQKEGGGAKGEKANVAEESIQQSLLPTILETDYEIQVFEAESEARKWEKLFAESEEEKAELAASAARMVSHLNDEWLARLDRLRSAVDSRLDALSSRLAPLVALVPRAQSAAVAWKMRAWEAEGLVHDLETDRVVAEDERRAMAERLREAEAEAQAPPPQPPQPPREVHRLAAKLWQEETKARHLESSLRSQKDHASKIINEMNRQHSAEVQELQQLLAATRARLQDQMSKLSSSSSSASVSNSAYGSRQQQQRDRSSQVFHTGQLVLQEMQAQNERLSSSMKALNGGGGSGSPRRQRGGGGHQSADDAGPWRFRRQEAFYFQHVPHQQQQQQQHVHHHHYAFQNGGGGGAGGPWSLPPPMTAPLSPFRRPPIAHVASSPYLHPGFAAAAHHHQQSSWTVFGHPGLVDVSHPPPQPTPPSSSSSAQQQQQQVRKRRPPPAPPGYVHVSQPGDTYI